MAYDPDRHHRRSIRLRGYDYRQPGAYFVTICTHARVCLFGDVVGGVLQLNAFGRIAADEWYRTAAVRSNVVLDAFVVMPNHVHGIIVIVETGDGGGVNVRTFGGAIAGSLSTIMRQYKSIATKRVHRRRGTPGAPVWQRGYYEHVIRNERALDRIRRYIVANPSRWRRDRNRRG